MSETNVVATNGDAEKLFNYLVAYRNRMGSQPEDTIKDSITVEAIPLEEYTTITVENY